eukprot:g1980.t1
MFPIREFHKTGYKSNGVKVEAAKARSHTERDGLAKAPPSTPHGLAKTSADFPTDHQLSVTCPTIVIIADQREQPINMHDFPRPTSAPSLAGLLRQVALRTCTPIARIEQGTGNSTPTSEFSATPEAVPTRAATFTCRASNTSPSPRVASRPERANSALGLARRLPAEVQLGESSAPSVPRVPSVASTTSYTFSDLTPCLKVLVNDTPTVPIRTVDSPELQSVPPDPSSPEVVQVVPAITRAPTLDLAADPPEVVQVVSAINGAPPLDLAAEPPEVVQVVSAIDRAPPLALAADPPDVVQVVSAINGGKEEKERLTSRLSICIDDVAISHVPAHIDRTPIPSAGPPLLESALSPCPASPRTDPSPAVEKPIFWVMPVTKKRV